MTPSDPYYPATGEDLFEENEFIEYDEASNGQRFLNYFIDTLLMQYALGYATGYLLAKFLMAAAPQAAYDLLGEGNFLTNYIITLLNHIIYYSICEKAFRGHTLGKLVTGTRAIREDGEELTFKDAFLRSLARLVPFEALSIWFGAGLWHDTWTKTKVIKTR